jgi:hypothetical protein
MAYVGILIAVVLHLLIKRRVRALLITPVIVFGLYSAGDLHSRNQRKD